MNTCLLVVLSVIVVSSAAVTPWTGPIADHTLGQLVQDTPEVAAAKRLHAETYSKVRSILPELPEEERFSGDEHEPVHVPQLQQFSHHVTVQPPFQQHFSHHVTAQPPVQHFPHDLQGENRPPWMGPFADHKLGEQVKETPEVAAARKHHETVYARVNAALPKLPEEHTERVRQAVVPFASQHGSVETAQARAIMERISQLRALLEHSTTPAPVVFNWNARPTETPEVAAARAEHARAIAAVLGH